MKTFVCNTSVEALLPFSFKCWSYSRNDTEIQLFINENMVKRDLLLYAARGCEYVTGRFVKEINEWLSVLSDKPYVLTEADEDSIEAALLQAIRVCEGKYGHNSLPAGDSQVVFALIKEGA